MSSVRRRFVGYDESLAVPNIVIDGSPNEATVLTLTHWPGIVQSPGTDVDTSAEMAFTYLDEPPEHEPAEVVTNNHYDQDGAVGLFALVNPSAALAHRELLVDLARAGDFGTYRYRNAARASMVLSAFADPMRSPVVDKLTGDGVADTAIIYEAILSQLINIVTDPASYRDLWDAEDDVLSASEDAITQGRINITEHPDIDLAVVEVDADQPARFGHRFSHMQIGPVHPMAIHNATDRARLLMMHRHRYSYIDPYETWVQFHTRTPAARVDLRPLADSLTASESGPTSWKAKAPSALTPILDHDFDSTLDPETLIARVRRHLKAAPPAWNPNPLV